MLSTERTSQRLGRQALWHAHIFGDPALTVGAIDLLVHHATIFEMNVESYRRRTVVGRKLKAEPQLAEPPA